MSMAELACDSDEKLSAFELDAVQLLQNQSDSWFGNVDECFRCLKMNRADLAFGNGGDARDHADEIAGLDRVRPADVEGEAHHPGFVRGGARFFARTGTFGAGAAVAPRGVVFVTALLAAIAGGWIGRATRGAIMIMIRSRRMRAAVLGNGALRFVLA